MTDQGPDTLPSIWDDVQARWTDAARNRRSPLHTPVVCSMADNAPAPRIMVLRAFSHEGMQFRFHTDARSPKVCHLVENPAISILGYDPEARIQLTVKGRGRILQSGPVVDAAWASSALSSRRCYLAANAPSSVITELTSGLPDYLRDRSPSEEESLPGRDNFAVLLVEAHQIEWLKLTSCGNQRARFNSDDGRWQGQWIAP